MTPSFRNRSHQCFLSYSHQDAAFVSHLVAWLREASITVWHDSSSLGVGEKVASVLPEQLATCRGMLLVASEKSMTSNWVKQEIRTALHENVENPAFAITILRIDDVDIGSHVPALKQFKWIDLKPDVAGLPIQDLVEVVNSLYRRHPSPVKNGSVDVYVSRSDRTPDERKRANEICSQILKHHGVQLIGDAIDQPDFSEDRIRTLMGTCSGHVMVLPARTKESDYKYFERERRISREMNIPCLVCAEVGSPLPASLKETDHLIEMEPSHRMFTDSAMLTLDAFLDDIRATTPRYSSCIFFAHEYNQNQERNKAARNLLSSVTGLTPQAGSDFTSAIGPQQILDGISRSSWFIADIASRVNPETSRLDINVNTCIEVGIALGAGLGRASSSHASGKADRPVYALSMDRTSEPQADSNGQGKTRDIPWMLRSGITIQWYKTEAAFLAIIHRIAHEHRRRLLNAEIGQG